MADKKLISTIVITSIFEPTEAVKAFAAMEDHRLVVIGDLKTPGDWHCTDAEYIGVEQQKKLDFSLAQQLPYNHYCRKMLGYLYAIGQGADQIIDTDDDNIPKPGWAFPAMEDEIDCLANDLGFVNIYQLFTSQPIWPRGLPLQLIRKDFGLTGSLSKQSCNIGIWQGLADEDPDVDAIYRLTSDAPCFFNEREPVALGYGTIAPFNTQNTVIRKELFALLYLPTYVTFRFTDILRGLVAQPIMALYGYQLGFTRANVVQKRNPHDYMKDFISEIPMYQHMDAIPGIVGTAVTKEQTIGQNLVAAYQALQVCGIVCAEELEQLAAWLADLNKALAGS